jgi:hypothetical protein
VASRLTRVASRRGSARVSFRCTTMSGAGSSSNSVKASTEGSKEPPKDANAPPTLGVLEEDDEFEEFPVQGAPFLAASCDLYQILMWPRIT